MQNFQERFFIIGFVWFIFYMNIQKFSTWIVFDIFGVEKNTHLGSGLEFFIYDTLKIFLLLTAMVYVIGLFRASLNTERVRDFLVGKKRFTGYFLASFFGSVTPFCSCSSIPLFIGFVSARIPLGITMAFLITSPLINEVAVVMLIGILGWKFTLVYVAIGMIAGILGGIIIDLLKADRWLQPFLLKHMKNSHEINSSAKIKLTYEQRHDFAYKETKDIFLRVWKWVLVGVGLGAIIHGLVPNDWISQNLGDGEWWSVPLGVIVGIPLYTNVTGIIPVMESLITKGLPIGTTLALCMSTVAISLPEILMLKQVMRWQLLSLFIGMMMIIFTLVGWFFNAFSFI